MYSKYGVLNAIWSRKQRHDRHDRPNQVLHIRQHDDKHDLERTSAYHFWELFNTAFMSPYHAGPLEEVVIPHQLIPIRNRPVFLISYISTPQGFTNLPFHMPNNARNLGQLSGQFFLCMFPRHLSDKGSFVVWVCYTACALHVVNRTISLPLQRRRTSHHINDIHPTSHHTASVL